MATYKVLTIAEAVEMIQQAQTIAKEKFADLSEHQLNWKPSASTWSIAECLDHLITTNQQYFPIFEGIIAGTKQSSFWEKLPFFPSLFGKMLVKGFAKDSTQKMKAPSVFKPMQGNIPADIVQRFDQNLELLQQAIGKLEGFLLDKMIITSPVAAYITYSLEDAITIVTTHVPRHVQQAIRVMKLNEFPTA